MSCLVTAIADDPEHKHARRRGVHPPVQGWRGPSATSRMPANLSTPLHRVIEAFWRTRAEPPFGAGSKSLGDVAVPRGSGLSVRDPLGAATSRAARGKRGFPPGCLCEYWGVEPRVARYSERPEFWDALAHLPDEVWPGYNKHGQTLGYYWPRLGEVFPEWQFVLYDDDDDDETVLAEGHTVPVAWDGTDTGLGPGIDATITGAFDLQAAGGRPMAVSALAAEIPRRHQRRGLARVMLQAMAGLARDAGLGHLIAPVRPTLKERYPITAIDRYARWTRPDGTPFDPWVRVHTQLGARIGPAIPHSLHITGAVGEWESWTGMLFPETGDYVFPAGLSPVHIDRDNDAGEYWEPNIWIIHQVGGRTAH
jgi:GNAT superfamily N-acetyltransferase